MIALAWSGAALAARRKAVLDRELDERCYVGYAELFHEAASVSIDAAG